jgi:hypothetical protein
MHATFYADKNETVDLIYYIENAEEKAIQIGNNTRC